MDLISILLSRKLNKGSGSGGTTNYLDLKNKPKINNVELSGNKTLENLGINIPEIPVNSVAGKTGAVTLNSEDIAFDESTVYSENTIGAKTKALETKIDSQVSDVQIDNATILDSNHVAKIPVIGMELNDDGTTTGILRFKSGYKNGFGMSFTPPDFAHPYLTLVRASDTGIKNGVANGVENYGVIDTVNYKTATFYGLAKAAGDVTQVGSGNEVGVYTDEAKSAIQTMLGLSNIIGVVEGTIASNAYAIGDIFLHAGALYKATAAIASGDTITPGINCVQTTLISIIKEG